MPLAKPVLQALKAVYSGTSEQRNTAWRQISGYGHVFAISAPPWRLDETTAAGKVVFKHGDVRVFELLPASTD